MEEGLSLSSSSSSDEGHVSRDSRSSINPRPKKQQKSRSILDDDVGGHNTDNSKGEIPCNGTIVMKMTPRPRSRAGTASSFYSDGGGDSSSAKSTITGGFSRSFLQETSGVPKVVTQTKELFVNQLQDFRQFADSSYDIDDGSSCAASIQSEMKRLQDLEKSLSWELQRAKMMAMGSPKNDDDTAFSSQRDEDDSSGNSNSDGVDDVVEQRTSQHVKRDWNDVERFLARATNGDDDAASSNSGLLSIQSQLKRLQYLENSLRNELRTATTTATVRNDVTTTKDHQSVGDELSIESESRNLSGLERDLGSLLKHANVVDGLIATTSNRTDDSIVSDVSSSFMGGGGNGSPDTTSIPGSTLLSASDPPSPTSSDSRRRKELSGIDKKEESVSPMRSSRSDGTRKVPTSFLRGAFLSRSERRVPEVSSEDAPDAPPRLKRAASSSPRSEQECVTFGIPACQLNVESAEQHDHCDSAQPKLSGLPCLSCSRSGAAALFLSRSSPETKRQKGSPSRKVIPCHPCMKARSSSKTLSTTGKSVNKNFGPVTADKVNDSYSSTVAVVEGSDQESVHGQSSVDLTRSLSPKTSGSVVTTSPGVPGLETTFCSSPSDSTLPAGSPDRKSGTVLSNSVDRGRDLSLSAKIGIRRAQLSPISHADVNSEVVETLFEPPTSSSPPSSKLTSTAQRLGKLLHRAVLSYPSNSSSSTTSSVSSQGGGVKPIGNADTIASKTAPAATVDLIEEMTSIATGEVRTLAPSLPLDISDTAGTVVNAAHTDTSSRDQHDCSPHGVSAAEPSAASSRMLDQPSDAGETSESHDVSRCKDERSLGSKVGRMAQFVLNLARRRDPDVSMNTLGMQLCNKDAAQIIETQDSIELAEESGKIQRRAVPLRPDPCEETNSLFYEGNVINDAGSLISEITGTEIEGSTSVRRWEHGQYQVDDLSSSTFDADPATSEGHDSQKQEKISETINERGSVESTPRFRHISPRDLFGTKRIDLGTESSAELDQEVPTNFAVEMQKTSSRLLSRKNTSSLSGYEVEQLGRQRTMSAISFDTADFSHSSSKTVVFWSLLSALSQMLYGKTQYKVTPFGSSHRSYSRSFQGTLCVFLASVNILCRLLNFSAFAPHLMLLSCFLTLLEVKTPHSFDESHLAFLASVGAAAFLRVIGR